MYFVGLGGLAVQEDTNERKQRNQQFRYVYSLLDIKHLTSNGIFVSSQPTNLICPTMIEIEATRYTTIITSIVKHGLACPRRISE